MKLFFDHTGTIEGLLDSIAKCSAHTRSKGLLVLCADANGFTSHDLDPLLQASELPIIGGIFPGIIYDAQLYNLGSLVIPLPGLLSIQTVPGLSDPDADYEAVLEEQTIDSSEVKTLILFVDGLAMRTSTFIESLFNTFGLDFNYVGGGSGSLTMVRKPSLLTPNGLLEDAAVMAFLSTDSGVGVCHGWQELAGPFQVTSAQGNTIHSIEWQPAFDFYHQILNEQFGVKVDRNDFYITAQHYPFGIARLSGEQVVRDPVMVYNDGSLICVGEIEEGAFISILQSAPEQLITAAGESVQKAIKAFPSGKNAAVGLFVDCISRTIVLGEAFDKELKEVQTGGLPFFGICSIGEIANSGTDFLEFYNKTSVMAVLEET